MNQILSIENNNKKNKRSKGTQTQPGIESIVKFFAIVILIFGLCMIGTGSYSMYKDSVGKQETSKPTISIQNLSETEIVLKVSHDKELTKVTYSWTGKGLNEIECEGKKTVEEKIEIPSGTNTLTIYTSDINGEENSHQQVYTLESETIIDFEVDGNSIKVIAEGQNELSYMTYRWDEEEETRVDINDTKIEHNVDIPVGLHTLTVIVVDSNNKTTTKEQEVKGVTKPKLEVTTDGVANFIIKASDEQGLEKVEFIINENEKYRINLEGRKELEYAYPLHDGENRLKVVIYNINGVTETRKVKLTK